MSTGYDDERPRAEDAPVPVSAVIGEGHAVTLETGSPVSAVADAYQREATALVRFATMLVGPTDADDVVSDALIAVLDRVERKPVDNPTAYLFRAVANKAKNHHRSSGRRKAREQRVAPPDVVAAVGAPAPEVAAAMRGLSRQQRAVIFLTYWADLTPPLVADYLGIGEGSVRKHLARGRAKLAEVLHD